MAIPFPAASRRLISDSCTPASEAPLTAVKSKRHTLPLGGDGGAVGGDGPNGGLVGIGGGSGGKLAPGASGGPAGGLAGGSGGGVGCNGGGGVGGTGGARTKRRPILERRHVSGNGAVHHEL